MGSILHADQAAQLKRLEFLGNIPEKSLMGKRLRNRVLSRTEPTRQLAIAANRVVRQLRNLLYGRIYYKFVESVEDGLQNQYFNSIDQVCGLLHERYPRWICIEHLQNWRLAAVHLKRCLGGFIFLKSRFGGVSLILEFDISFL